MSNETRETMAAEEGLQSIERLYAVGDTQLAKLALELVGPGIEGLANPAQSARLKLVASAIAKSLGTETDRDEPGPTSGRRM